MISNFQLDIDMTPRAYQKIPNTLSRLLGNARFVKDVSFAPECKCLVFEDDKERPVVALWGKNQKVDFGFKSGSRACTDFADLKPEVFDLMENKREIIPDRDGKVMIPVSAFPFFFRGEPGKTAEYCEIFAKAQISDGLTIPLNLNFKTTSSEEIELMVRNLISRQVEGVLTVNDERRKINVEPGAAESFPVKLPQPLRTDKIIEELVPVLLEEKGNPAKLNSTISFPGFLCRKSDGPFKIDGSLEDWRGIPSISLINKNLSKRYGSRNYPEDDFKGQFRVAWDKNNLYLAVEITDNHFVHKEDYPGTPGHRWNNDSMQIYFDTFCDARQKSESGYFGYDANDYDFAVFPNATGDDARVFRFYAVDRQLAMGVEIFKENVFEPNISSAFKKTKNGYVYELAFPAKYILPVKLENGYSIGFGLYVNDRDLEKHVKQALTLTPPDTGCYRSPHLYPVMLLTE